MQFSFNYSTLRGFFDSFKSADRERAVPMINGEIKVQRRGAGKDARFYLRMRAGWSNYQYQRMDRHQMLALAEALIEISNEGKETQ